MKCESNILITGSTGNLGCQLLKLILLDKMKYKIFLLIKSESKSQARKKIINLLKWLFGDKYKNYLTSNVVMLHGDLTKSKFGLSDKEYNSLIQKVDIIYHSAALTRFNENISKLRLVNVGGTQKVLDFIAQSKKSPKLHYISTIFIVGNFRGKFKETDFNVAQGFYNPYEQSKFEAEKIVRDFNKKRGGVTIYRPSIIVGEYKTGSVSNFQMFYHPLYLLSKEVFDEIPINRNTILNIIPVDVAAKMIHILAKNSRIENSCVYHIVSPKFINLIHVINLAANYFNFRKPKFLIKSTKISNLGNQRNKTLQPILDYFQFNTQFESRATINRLKILDFKFLPINEAFLKRIFSYAAKMGYIKINKYF